MNEINGNIIYDLMKQSDIVPDFTDDEYEKLITNFRQDKLNQFYMFIIQRVLTKKDFTENKNTVILQLTAILTDKVGKTTTPTNTDSEIKSLCVTLYKLLFLIDVKVLYSRNF